MNHLLILDNDADIYGEEIGGRNLSDLIINTADSIDAAEKYIGDVNLVLSQPALIAPLLDKAKKLHWLQSTFAGIEPLCLEGLRTDYLLTGVKGVFGPLMSEYVFAYILAHERSLLATRENQNKKIWSPIPYRSLENVTIGIIGLGSIGKHIAATASHFGMHVLGMKRTQDSIDTVSRIFLPSEKSTLLPLVDYLVITLPATDQTNHFISLEDLKMMKPTAILMSVGRGNAIDQEGLSTALKNNDIGGAVLDVFQQEPLPEDSPLWEMDNVYITPHNSALSFPTQIVSLFSENYKRFLSGQKLKHVVDFNTGY